MYDLSIFEYKIKFSKPFTSSKVNLDYREGILLKLIDATGNTGFGEVSPLPSYSLETYKEAFEQILSIKTKLLGLQDFSDNYQNLSEFLQSFINENKLFNTVAFGIETAIYDLVSKRAGLSLTKWINNNARKKVAVNILLPSDIKNIAIYKFKLNSNLDSSISQVQRICKTLPVGSKLRLDANQCFKFDEALELLLAIKDLPIEYIEEPLVCEELNRIKELKVISNIKLALDESLIDPIFAKKVLEQDLADVLVLKPAICGGITSTIKLAQLAKKYNKQITITSMLESGIGITACLHTALAISDTLACGLNTLNLLEDSLLEFNPAITNNFMHPFNLPGLGVSLSPSVKF